MRKEYKCNCEDNCGNNLIIEYSGNNLFLLSSRQKELKELDKMALNNVYFRTKKDKNSVRIEASKIPEMIKDLQKMYSKYQEVLKIQKEKGRLENLAEDNKANLSDMGLEK